MTDFGGAIRKNKKYDLAILGVPFDEKSSYLRGAALGPQAIRAASTGKAHNPWTETGVNLEEDAVMADLGDVDTSGDVDKTFQRVDEAVSGILAKNAVPIVLGGDHSITYWIVRAVARKYKDLDILHFDAHPDLYDNLYQDRLSHACPFARIMEDGLARSLVQVGIRTANSDQRGRARKYKVRMIEMKDLRDDLRLEFGNPLYVSFDFDCLDPAFAPGVSHQVAGGLSTRQAINLIHTIETPIVGCDLVELNPTRDPSGITASAGFKIVMELAGTAVKNRKRRWDRR